VTLRTRSAHTGLNEFAITPVACDGYRLLRVEGDLDMTNAAELVAALDACMDGLPVIVDLTELTFIESGGLHALLGGRGFGRPSAVVRAPQSNIARVLDLVRAREAVPLYDNVAEAAERLRDAS
jgi:anti-anti-sigma factor